MRGSGIAAVFLAPLVVGAGGNEVVVRDTAGLRQALRALRAGTTVVIAPGEYEGGLFLERAVGTEREPVVIRAADPAKPPLLRGGGSEGLHLTDCSFVRLEHLRVAGYAGNGINIDDGGTIDTPSRNITLLGVAVEDTGPQGNHDALKMSGVERFLVKDCRFEGWGGSAIDMVGCRDGVVEGCRFLGKPGFSASSGVQLKGGTRGVRIERCWFRDAGERAVNLGGSTGLAYFRPPDAAFEAKDIEVAGNRFHGSMAPLAWVTAAGGSVHHNTFHLPGRWALRILQEQADARFPPCAGGSFEENLVVLGPEVATVVNVGPRTEPATFRFRRNAWWVAGGGRRPALPAEIREEDAVLGVDPALEDAGGPAMRVGSRDPRLRGIGADGYRAR